MVLLNVQQKESGNQPLNVWAGEESNEYTCHCDSQSHICSPNFKNSMMSSSQRLMGFQFQASG